MKLYSPLINGNKGLKPLVFFYLGGFQPLVFFYLGGFQPLVFFYLGGFQPLVFFYLGGFQPLVFFYLGGFQPLVFFYLGGFQPLVTFFLGAYYRCPVFCSVGCLAVKICCCCPWLVLSISLATSFADLFAINLFWSCEMFNLLGLNSEAFI